MGSVLQVEGVSALDRLKIVPSDPEVAKHLGEQSPTDLLIPIKYGRLTVAQIPPAGQKWIRWPKLGTAGPGLLGISRPRKAPV